MPSLGVEGRLDGEDAPGTEVDELGDEGRGAAVDGDAPAVARREGAEEMIEAIRYLENPNFYTKLEDPLPGNIWLGAADDVIFRKRGIEFVDGTAPGFAAIVGAAPSPEIAKKIATELQEKNLYVFMCAHNDGKHFSEQNFF